MVAGATPGSDDGFADQSVFRIYILFGWSRARIGNMAHEEIHVGIGSDVMLARIRCK